VINFSPTRSQFFRNAFCAGVAAILCSSCSQRPKQNLFEGNVAQDAAKKIGEKISGPVRVLKIEIEYATLSIQVQDSAQPTQVNEYTYRNLTGLPALILPAVAGPTPVRLHLSNPNLEENLFNLDQIDLSAIPTAVQEAVRRVALDGGIG
jgi:hypothetical protein